MISRAMRAALLCALVTPGLAVLTSTPASAETVVSGLIGEDTTWTAAESPYVLDGDVTIAASATLTIEPGVTVQRRPHSRSGLVIEGTLDAAGTTDAPISWEDEEGYYSGWPFIRPGAAASGSVSLFAVAASRQNLVASDRFDSAAEFAEFELVDSRLEDSDVRVDGSEGPVVITGNAVSQRSILVNDPTSTTTVVDNRFRSSSFVCSGTGRLELASNTFERGLHSWQGSRVASQGDCVIDANDNFWEATANEVRGSRLEGSDRIQLTSVLDAPSASTPTLVPAPQTHERFTDQNGRSILRIRAGSDGGAPATIVASAVNRETGEVEESHEVSAPTWNAESRASVDITFSDLVPGQLYRLTSRIENAVGTNTAQETESFLAPEQTDGPPPPPGTLTEDTTWTKEMSPIVLSRTVTVSEGVTLTIEPGVEVESAETLYQPMLVLRGQLVSAGSEDEPVLLSRSTQCCGFALINTPSDSADTASAQLRHTTVKGAEYNTSLFTGATPSSVSIVDSTLDGLQVSVDATISTITFERNRVRGRNNGAELNVNNPTDTVVVRDNRFRDSTAICSGAGRLSMSGNTFERTSRAGSNDDCILDLTGNFWEVPDAAVGNRVIGAGRVTVLPTAGAPTDATPDLEPDDINIYRNGSRDLTALRVSAGSNGGSDSTITASATDRETGEVAETQTLPLARAQDEQVTLYFTKLQPGRLYRISAFAENAMGRTATVETESFVIPADQQEPNPDGGIMVSGTLTADTTWTIDDSPVTVVAPLVVPAGRTLRVEPGVLVRGRNINYSEPVIRIGGTFDAQGEPGMPVVLDTRDFTCCNTFTSPRDIDGGTVSLRHVDLRSDSRNRLWGRFGTGERAAERIIIEDSTVSGVRIDAYDVEGTKLAITRTAWTGGNLDLTDVPETTSVTHNRFRAAQLSCDGTGRLTATHNTFERGSTRLSSRDDCILDVSNSHWEVPDEQVPGRISGAARAIIRPLAAAPSAGTPRLAPARPDVYYRLDTDGDAVATTHTNSDGGAPASVTVTLVDRETGETVAEMVEPSTVPGQEITTTFEDLTAGRLYRISAVAQNAVGTSPASTTESFLAPRPGPDTPTRVTAVASGTSVTLTWQAPPAEGAESLTGFVVEGTPGGFLRELGPDARTTTFDGLDAGDYAFTVRAVNAFGTSERSDAASATVAAPASGGGGSTGGSPGGGGGGGGSPAQVLPAAPSNVVAERGDGRAMVSWTPPAKSSTVTGYLVYVAPGDRVIAVEGAVSSMTVLGLTNGEAYSFAVEAVNARGAGERSASTAPVTPAGPPAATTLTVKPGDRSLDLSWPAADDNGAPVTGYVVTVAPSAQRLEVGPNLLATTLLGLDNGIEHEVSVVAVNDVGEGEAVSATATPGLVPTAPAGLTAAAGDGRIDVSWQSSTARGYDIKGYRIEVTPGSMAVTVDAAQTAARVTGLTNGRSYDIEVVALSALGESDPAVLEDTTPVGSPARIDAPALKAKKRGIKVTWEAPDDGGAAIRRYVVTGNKGLKKVVRSRRTAVVFRGLTEGQAYKFRVQAVTDIGTSTRGRWSERVTW